MRLANLSPETKEDGKNPLERMLLETVDAALVGALIEVHPIIPCYLYVPLLLVCTLLYAPFMLTT